MVALGARKWAPSALYVFVPSSVVLRGSIVFRTLRQVPLQHPGPPHPPCLSLPALQTGPWPQFGQFMSLPR